LRSDRGCKFVCTVSFKVIKLGNFLSNFIPRFVKGFNELSISWLNSNIGFIVLSKVSLRSDRGCNCSSINLLMLIKLGILPINFSSILKIGSMVLSRINLALCSGIIIVFKIF